MLSESIVDTLEWVALGGYLLVIVFVVPLLVMRDYQGHNHIVIGILIFSIILGLSIIDTLFLHWQGFRVVLLNIAWVTLLYQTGVMHEWWATMRKRRQI